MYGNPKRFSFLFLSAKKKQRVDFRPEFWETSAKLIFLPGYSKYKNSFINILKMAETDFTSDVTAENGNNLEDNTQEEPNPERK